MTFLIGLVGLVIVLGVAIAYGALRNKGSFERSNQIVPGTASRAPGEWAGAHSPEALLHRRLIAAVAAARAQSGVGDVQQAVERGALEIDDRLIAAAALPAANRADAITAIEPSVIALENAVSGVKPQAVGEGAATPALDSAVIEVQNRLDAVAEARAEVDQLDTTGPMTSPPPPPPTTSPPTPAP